MSTMTFSSCHSVVSGTVSECLPSASTLTDEKRTMKTVYITPKSTRSISTSCTARPELPKWRFNSLRCSLSKKRQLHSVAPHANCRMNRTHQALCAIIAVAHTFVAALHENANVFTTV